MPAIDTLALSPLPQRYESQVVEALHSAGIEVVPRSDVAFELVVYLGTPDANRTERGSPSRFGEGPYENDTGGSSGWGALAMWLADSLSTAPGTRREQSYSKVDEEQRPLLVQLVDTSSDRVVWSCEVVQRGRWGPRSEGVQGGDRDTLQEALGRFIRSDPRRVPR